MGNKTKLIICPTDAKIKYLKELNKNNELYNIKFMTKEDFIRKYYFDYSYEALFYLIKKYNLQIDVAKVYLDNLYVIDEDSEYNASKLKFLKKLKLELKENNYLEYSPSFHKWLSQVEIEVSNYYDLDLYIEKALGINKKIADVQFNKDIYAFKTMEEEVTWICCQIRGLMDKGISLNNIYLGNVSSDYYYTIEKIFSYYHIPINIPYKKSIYSTKIIQDYLNTFEIDVDDSKKISIYKKLFTCLEKLNGIDKDDPIYNLLLEDLLKHTYLDNKIKKNSINIIEIEKQSFNNEDYVFVVGFNQDILPRTVKDIGYISDSIKEEVEMYNTTEMNDKIKKSTIYILSNIDNLFLSYKETTPFASFYPSSLIHEYNLNIIKPEIDIYKYSNIYNKIKLTEMLDLYYLYGEENSNLSKLFNNYKIDYRTYSNQFTGINNDLYLKNLDYPLKLSYTGINSYNECSFKYYISKVLKLDEYTSTFAAFIGSMYHEILSLFDNGSFDLDNEFNKYLEKRDLSLKETVLLVRIKKDLVKLIDIIKKQKLIMGYDSSYCEKKIEITVREDIAVSFVGIIDKILFYEKIDDTYFSIIDYKSGNIDIHIEPMKYGLHMQLPIYLYLIYYSKVFSNPIFTGIYYQNILFSYPSWSLKLEKEEKDKYMLKGYSTDNIELLERFDSTCFNSELIKSMKYDDDKGFGTYSKVLDDEMVLELIKYTKKHIEEKTDDILKGRFSINPKVYNGENIACRFCQFKDLCYMREADLVYLEKQEDLSFLGGDE